MAATCLLELHLPLDGRNRLGLHQADFMPEPMWVGVVEYDMVIHHDVARGSIVLWKPNQPPV